MPFKTTQQQVPSSLGLLPLHHALWTLDTGLQIDCPAPSTHTLRYLDTCCGGRGSNNGMCFNSLLGWMTGNALMITIL